ncbi:MAG: tetratricopeptide repeat protein [Cyanobacteria bacterium SZAS LIN-5]|nr:tetratricopeptide repeat protein [Cyanobacteria bacterium SZAS LIN-5]
MSLKFNHTGSNSLNTTSDAQFAHRIGTGSVNARPSKTFRHSGKIHKRLANILKLPASGLYAMQDFVSNSYAPHFSESFGVRQPTNFPPALDLSAQTRFRAPATPHPTSRGELIFQQERRIRNDFIRKPSTSSNRSSLTVLASGKVLQSKKCEGTNKHALSERRLKFIASTVAFALILFTGYISISFLTQPFTSQTLCKSTPKQSITTTPPINSMASTGTVATLSSGTTRTELSRNTVEDEAREMKDLIAIARAHAMATKPGESQDKRTESDLSNQSDANLGKTSDLNLNKTSNLNLDKTGNVNLTAMTTVDLVKTGYEKLRSGSAQESITVLSEAVRRDSNDPTSRRYLGYALLKTGRPAEALNQYKAVQSLSGLMETDRIAVQHAKYLLQTGNKPTESESSKSS